MNDDYYSAENTAKRVEEMRVSMRRYKAKLAAELRRAPQEVRDVLEAFRASAKEAGLPRNAAYAGKEADGSWVIGPNTEGWGGSYVFKDGKWFSRDRSTGEDRPVTNGFYEARDDARICFTG